jgi:hypothetical protein
LRRFDDFLTSSLLARGVSVLWRVIYNHRSLATTMEEPLARLVAFEPTTFPVLSIYLNTQPDQHGRTPDPAPYLHREFKALARTWEPSSPERQSFDRDVERIVSYATDKIESAANGVAIFTCWGAEESFEAIQLTNDPFQRQPRLRL